MMEKIRTKLNRLFQLELCTKESENESETAKKNNEMLCTNYTKILL